MRMNCNLHLRSARTTLADLEDYRWLVGPDAAGWLALLADESQPSVAFVARLRRELPSERVHLLLEQADLRRRAEEKFSAAASMYFTPVALQQASDEIVADYKAERFDAGAPAADLCCGIGGDLLALARRGSVTGADRNPVAALLAEANLGTIAPAECDARHLVVALDAESFDLSGCAAWHIDPDRRPAGRRTTRVELHDPPADAIERLLQRNADAAVKLSPAAVLPEGWPQRAELEWIGRHGQCRQLVAWFGRLARSPGRRRATLVKAAPRHAVTRAGQPEAVVLRTLAGDPAPVETFAPLGQYVYEPDAAVLAADLAAALAAEHGLAALSPGIAYFTSDRLVTDPTLAAFVVTDVLPFDVKRLKSLLRARRIGRLVVKKRGTPHDPAVVWRQLQVPGDESATLLLAPIGGKVMAILGQRV
jgi:hypothetical protein